FPGDLASARFLDQAEKAVASAGRRQEEDGQRATEVQKLLAAGQEALAARDLFNAGRAFQAAAQLAPADVAVFQARQDFLRTLEALRAEEEGRRRVLDAFQALVRSGRDALEARRFEDAVVALSAARGLVPDDPVADDLLRRALRERDRVRSAAEA